MGNCIAPARGQATPAGQTLNAQASPNSGPSGAAPSESPRAHALPGRDSDANGDRGGPCFIPGAGAISPPTGISATGTVHLPPPATAQHPAAAAPRRANSDILAQSVSQPDPLAPLSAAAWAQVRAIRRSVVGVNEGAFFCFRLDGHPLVLKPSDPGCQQFLATRFLQHLGLRPPQVDLWRGGTPAFAALSALVERLGQPAHDPLRLPSQRRVQHVLRFEYIVGATLHATASTLSQTPIRQNLPPKFYRAVGFLVVVDLFMGNADRFDLQHGVANLGNVMFAHADAAMRPIDQICPLLLEEHSDSLAARRASALLRRFALTAGEDAALLLLPLLPPVPQRRAEILHALRQGLAAGLELLADGRRLRQAWARLRADAACLGAAAPRWTNFEAWRQACLP